MKTFSMIIAAIAASAASNAAADSKLALDASPNLGNDVDKVVFGELWERPELGKRDRSLVTVAAIVAQGRLDTLAFHLSLALDHGVKPQELAGAITHLGYYSGMPAAIEAAPILGSVFADRDVDLSTLRLARSSADSDEDAEAALRDIVNGMVGDVSPGLAHFTNTTLNGDLWLRDDLSPRDRSLVTVSALIAQGNVAQLSAHVPKGLRNGLTRAEIGETIAHLAFYAGWPRAFSAATTIKSMDLPD